MKNLYRFTQIFSKKYFVLFLIIYFAVGVVVSLNVGISHDEFHEQQNWEYNKTLVQNFIENKKEISDFRDRYYGIGFQIVSQPFQYIIQKIIRQFLDIDIYGAKLTSKHPIIFIFHLISGLFFFKILNRVTNSINYSYSGTILYLIYPYLLGHSFANPKDIPFSSIWIMCTYLSFNIFDLYIREKKIKIICITLLALSIAFLLSIRIAGILIFVQLFILLFFFLNNIEISFKDFINKIFTKLVFLFLLVLFFTVLFYPIFWNNPLEIIQAIKFMGKFSQDVCTLTLGKCVKSLNIDPYYIPIWFFFKLPLIILFGILLIPFTERKIFNNKINNIYFGTILLSSFIIPVILIIKNVPLYDEVRHVLFLTPLFFLLGLMSLYFFSKKTSFILIFVYLIFFAYENFKMFPYQYTWLNLPARFLDIGKNFELEYLGISGKELAKKINIKNQNNYKNTCIVVSPVYSVQPFLKKEFFNCYYPWQLVESDLPRPFWAVQIVRNIKKSIPYKCRIISQEKISLTFYKKDLIAGNLLECY